MTEEQLKIMTIASPRLEYPEQEKMYTLERMAYNYLCDLNTLPDSRERALAITKLEESLLWAEKCLKTYTATKKKEGK